MSLLERLRSMSIVCPIKIGEVEMEAFYLDYFRASTMCFTPLHSHMNTEVHYIIEGQAEYTIDDQKYIFGTGDTFCIPNKALHTSNPLDTTVLFTSFTINYPCPFNQKKLSLSAQNALMDAFQESQKSKSVLPIIPYFYMFLVDLLPQAPFALQKNTNYPDQIFEYLGMYYNQDISLADISAALNLSPKQTQRIIMKETGLTFLELLTSRRMHMADYLIDHSNMTLNEIAQYVGYSSYSGFWKARKRFQTEKQKKA